MSTATATVLEPVKVKRMSFAKWLKSLAWRHMIALLAIAFALFPLIWMASASFDRLGNISAQQLIPQYRGLDNYRRLFSNPEQPYWIWMRNSVLIASINAVVQLSIGATAAYALSRFRYKGRKATLLTDRKSTCLNSSHVSESRMPSSA